MKLGSKKNSTACGRISPHEVIIRARCYARHTQRFFRSDENKISGWMKNPSCFSSRRNSALSLRRHRPRRAQEDKNKKKNNKSSSQEKQNRVTHSLLQCVMFYATKDQTFSNKITPPPQRHLDREPTPGISETVLRNKQTTTTTPTTTITTATATTQHTKDKS